MKQAMTAAAFRWGRISVWLLVPLSMVGIALSERRMSELGRSELVFWNSAGIVPFLAATLSCWLVGLALTLRVPNHVVGWLFLGLATSISVGGFFDSYANEALRAEPGVWPLGEVAAVFGDSIFIWWFLFIALILQLTPTGKPLAPRWAALARLTTASAVAFFIAALFRSTPLEGENAGLVSPFAVSKLAGLFSVAGLIALAILGLSLLASAYVLAVRFRRSKGDERRQLLWLVAGAAPLPICLAVSFGAAFAGHDLVAGGAVSTGLAFLAAGAGFAIARFRLYGVERVVGDATAYMLSSLTVIAVYGAVVLVLTRSTPGVRTGSSAMTILATLAAAGAALPTYRWSRTAVDRRFNRRRFEAVQVLRLGLDQSAQGLDDLMIAASGDPHVRLLFPAGESGWVSSDGRAALPGGNVVDVVRRDVTAAKVEFDAERTDRVVVEALAQEAAAEIDNLGLRAELARQLQQISESRARLAGAHLEERRRMERDLHDGAQQRLLAIALQLQSARVNGAEEILRKEVDSAVSQLGSAVQELRDLASGLQPAALSGGGLRAAVEELAARIPLDVRLDVIDRRFDPATEGAAWFVVAEAVSNVVKHARVGALRIEASVEGSSLRLAVTDGGVGGADKRGRGLQGLADRVAALGGNLTVRDLTPQGTEVEATFPCAS